MSTLQNAVTRSSVSTGRYNVYLAEHGHQIIGVDLSPEMLARARQKLPNSDFREGDLEALPLETASVDAAVCALALVHLPDPQQAIAELAQVVKPGGLQVHNCHEPRLTHNAAVTIAADRLPEANQAAYVDLPGVITWDLEK